VEAVAHEARIRGRRGHHRSRRLLRVQAPVALALVSTLCLIAGVAPAAAAVTYNGTVASFLDAVSQAELRPVVADLSGAQSCTIGGSPYTFTTRHSGSGEPIDMAEQYVYEKLQSYGLDSVSYDAFTLGAGGRNVVGEITGSSPTRAGEIVVIGAHLDDKAPGSDVVPGADDNASGVSAMLFLARTLAAEEYERTIRFVAFGDEEWGLAGSQAYAQDCRSRGENVVAMVSADMLGYSNGSGTVDMRVRPASQDPDLGDRAIAQTGSQVLSTYGIALTPVIREVTAASSDCDSFWSRGYHAILLIEGTSPMNPYYHTAGDTIATLDWTHYVRVTRALTGQAAHLARIDTTGPVVSGVSSPTHPAARTWYPVTTASLSWTASETQTGVSGYSYVIDRNADTVADATSEGGDTSYTSGALPQGVSYFHVRARDGAGNWGATVHRALRVDTVAPTTMAPYRASVLRGGIATLRYKVVDATPNAGTADVTIRVKTLGGRTVAKLVLDDRAVNDVLRARFRCRLVRKTYRFFVYAADAAGNRQLEVGSNLLMVR
jgi:hypothetical protein